MLIKVVYKYFKLLNVVLKYISMQIKIQGANNKISR